MLLGSDVQQRQMCPLKYIALSTSEYFEYSEIQIIYILQNIALKFLTKFLLNVPFTWYQLSSLPEFCVYWFYPEFILLNFMQLNQYSKFICIK